MAGSSASVLSGIDLALGIEFARAAAVLRGQVVADLLLQREIVELVFVVTHEELGPLRTEIAPPSSIRGRWPDFTTVFEIRTTLNTIE